MQRRAAALVALCAADFLVVLDGLIVAVALPAVQQALAFRPADLQWVISAYALCFGGVLLLGGRLADLYGRRRVLVTGLVLFALGALVGGLAWSPVVLVAGRALQGVGAALMTPAALALLVAGFAEGPDRDRALGIWSAAGSVGIPAGALLSGVLTATAGWRWVLLVNVPAAVLAAAMTVRTVPESRDRSAPRRSDWLGAVLVTAGLAVLVAAVSRTERLAAGEAGAGTVLVPLAAAGVLLAGFVAVERRAATPLVPPRVLGASWRAPALLVGLVLPVGLGTVLFLATLSLQQVLGVGALRTGLAYLVLALPVVAASPLASRLIGRLGRRGTAVLGLLVQAAGLLAAGLAGPGGLLVAFVLVGLGAPLAFVPATSAAMGASGAASGVLSGLFNTVQQVGNALALALVATVAAVGTAVAAAGGEPGPAALTAGHRAGFLLAAVLAALALPAAARLPAPSGRPGSRPRAAA